jgi:hypothetical protein
MQAFTLDTNCLIAVAKGEPGADAIQALANAHAEHRADVAVVAISASENPRISPYTNFAEFRGWLGSIELGHLNIIFPMCYWGVSFWGHCLWGDGAMINIERQIHEILFPSVKFLWKDYSHANGLDPLTARS